MRLDGFYPSAQPARAPRPAGVPVGQASIPAAPVQQPQLPPAQAVSAQPMERAAASGEYIPARQGPGQPVHGHVNQALASYQSMASLQDGDADGVFGVDLFV